MTRMFVKWIWIIPSILANAAAIDTLENEISDHHINTHHPNPKSPASELPLEVDILKLMNVSSKDQGVSIVEGPIAKFPAYKFRLPYNNVLLSNSSFVTRAINSHSGFTVVFLIRQQKNNLGTLLSINSPGKLTPWFQLVSNSKNGMLTLKYKIREAKKVKQIDWLLPKHHKKTSLAAWTWISLNVDYKGDIIRLDLDCTPSKFEALSFSGKQHQRLEVPDESLIYFGQEPGRKKKFLGSIQVAKILPYVTEDRLWTCLQISENLAPEIRKPLSS